MAKDTRKPNDETTGTSDDSIPKPVVEEMRKIVSEDRDPKPVREERTDPIRDIALALVGVAKGGSVLSLREVITAGAPAKEDGDARRKYAAQLRRLRDGAEVALTLAMELASGV